MFEIRINDRPADLNPNASYELNLASPVFSHDSFFSPMAAVLPDLPNTPANRQLIGHFNTLQASVYNTRHKVDNYINGHLVASGIFVLQEASHYGFKGGITQNLNEFFGHYQNLSIQDLDLGTITIPASVPDKISLSGIDAVFFPKISNASYFGGQMPGYVGVINNFVPGTVTANSPLVPMLSVRYLLHQIASLTGVTITGSFLSDPDFLKLILVQLRSQATGTVKLNTLLPNITLSGLLLELRKVFNLHFDFNTVLKTLTITKLSISTDSVANWQSISESREIKIPEQYSRMSFALTHDQNDQYQKLNPATLELYTTESQYIPDGGITTIQTLFSTILKHSGTGLGILDQAGITDLNGQVDKSTSPRLAFINSSASGLTAHYEAPSGLYNLSPQSILTYHYDRIAAIRSQAFYVKKQMFLTEAHLARLDFTQPIYFNGMHWLLLSANVSLPITQSTECLFVKI